MPTITTKNPDIERDRMAGRLPLKARRKIEAWREQEREALSLVQSDAERLIELQGAKAQATFELAELEAADKQGKLFIERQVADPNKDGSYLLNRTRDTNRLDAARAAVDRAQDQIDRMRERKAGRGRTPLNAVETYLKSLGNVELTEHDGPPAKLPKGESWLSAIERARASISNLRDEAAAIKLAPHPTSVAKVKAAAEIEKLANQGQPGVLALIERAGSIRWPVYPLQNVELRDGHIPQLPDVYAFLAWLFRGIADAMAARKGKTAFTEAQWKELTELFRSAVPSAVDTLIDEFGDDEGALTDKERAARLSEIAKQILAERSEEGLIEAAEAEGIVIVRRGDADPRALLNLADSLPPYRRAA